MIDYTYKFQQAYIFSEGANKATHSYYEHYASSNHQYDRQIKYDIINCLDRLIEKFVLLYERPDPYTNHGPATHL